MAMKIATSITAGGASPWLDVRSVGSKIMPMRVTVCDNLQTVTVEKAPESDGSCSSALGTVNAGGGSVVVDEPIDYLRISTDPLEAGLVNAFLETSR
jgi:hypothetical protein